MTLPGSPRIALGRLSCGCPVILLLASLLVPSLGCTSRPARPARAAGEEVDEEATGGGLGGLKPKALPDDPDVPLRGRLLVLDKPAPERLAVGYQKTLLALHRGEVRRGKKGWVLNLFAHAHAGEGQLGRARLEVRAGGEANLEDPPLHYEPLNLAQHEVRMARTVILRKDPAFVAGRQYRLVVVVTGATPLKIAETVITLR